MRVPDFFIIGASKCGTTALSKYLSEHPGICFARTKEPHYFSDDFPVQKLDNNFAQYWRRNFSHFDARKHGAIGEGSGTYYISQVAIANILRQNPAAKFIFMVRNPVDMVQSWYNDLRFANGEDVSLEEGWDLQPVRLQGLKIPRQLREPRFLQYHMMASFGRRLEVFKKLIPPGRLLVIVFDDFVRDPKAAYENVLAFIGVRSDGRESFPKVNAAKDQRSRLIGAVSSSMPRWVSNAAREIKILVGMRHARLNVFAVLNTKPAKRVPLSPEFRKRLVIEFEPEVRLLERHLDRDLSHWRT